MNYEQEGVWDSIFKIVLYGVLLIFIMYSKMIAFVIVFMLLYVELKELIKR